MCEKSGEKRMKTLIAVDDGQQSQHAFESE